MKRKYLAIIIGVFGLIGMFFFPSPEENFLYYVVFFTLVVVAIISVLKFNKKHVK